MTRPPLRIRVTLDIEASRSSEYIDSPPKEEAAMLAEEINRTSNGYWTARVVRVEECPA